MTGTSSSTNPTIHALAGLPRSGSTLLGNILAQHPDVHVSGTSALSSAVEQVLAVLGNSPEIQSDLTNVPGSYERYLAALRGLTSGWYSDIEAPVVVDKGRGWIVRPVLLQQLYPGAQMIVCVRDPRDVIASVERIDRKTPAFPHPMGQTIVERTTALMNPQGIVGGPCRFIESALQSRLPGLIFVRYETLTVNPDATVARVVEQLGLSPHTYDFDDVINIATDLDPLYRHKYPHDASGPVKPNESTWRDVMDDDLARRIAVSYPLFMQTFNYV